MRILRNTLASLAVGAFLLVTAGSAFADVNARAVVRISKDVFIVEQILILKGVLIIGVVLDRAEKAAESLALINQENQNNKACENCAEKTDKIIDSVHGNEGITTVNQAAGNMNNQATTISVAFDNHGDKDPDDPEPSESHSSAFAESQAIVDQLNDDNTADSHAIIFRDGLIEESVNGNVGITAVNQATGNMNNQANIVSAAIALESGVALSEGLLGQENSRNDNIEFDIFKTAKIIGSIHGNSGVTQVNQASGNFANQANVASISLTIGGL